MIVSNRLYNLLILSGVGIIGTIASINLIYPYAQQRRLLKLLEKLDEEGKVDEMKEIVKSPYLKNFTFEFKDELSTDSQNE